MTRLLSFQTRARTIDHLGREQIADVPTAVSELWKNAYDAYATSVALHIYAGVPPGALIADDGHGMTSADFVDKWLVVGTESKATASTTPKALRRDLAERTRQGQKGIGRLSVAALGPAALIVSKQEAHPFVACLIDWRIFENPFVFLQDVLLPITEFKHPGDLDRELAAMRKALLGNLGDGPEKAPPDPRRDRLKEAWRLFDEVERQQTKAPLEPFIPTSARIRIGIEAGVVDPRRLEDWPSWTQAGVGTAIVIGDVNDALAAWVIGGDAAASESAASVRDSLVRTLSGFSDPYTKSDDTMAYKVIVHEQDGVRPVIDAEDGYGLDFLHSLDHCIEGEFNDQGVFRGRVRAFGKDLGEVEIPSSLPAAPSGRERVGSFSLAIGAFEPKPRSSTLAPDVHRQVAKRAETQSGLSVYRDGLRVMPYGRPENDFFKIEERRQFQAGREFWSSRRMFGRIAITRAANPQLRDKAGREGLIDNAAARTMQLMVIDLLMTSARRWFGGESDFRKNLLPEIIAENDKAAAAAKATRKRQSASFRATVRRQTLRLHQALAEAEGLGRELQAVGKAANHAAFLGLGARVDAMLGERAALTLPAKPHELGSFEDDYRDYRDAYNSFAEIVDDISAQWRTGAERLARDKGLDIAEAQLTRARKAVEAARLEWAEKIPALLSAELERWNAAISAEALSFDRQTAPLLTQLRNGTTNLNVVLDEVGLARDRIIASFSERWRPYFTALTDLSNGLDLDAAFAYAGAREATLERRLEQMQSLAQVGISVEILSHELRSLDNRLAAGLAALPKPIHTSPAFKAADEARRELVERLRFLSNVQIAGGDVRREITGAMIAKFVGDFFAATLKERGVAIETTASFNEAAFEEYPSRIFPVFTNLVNNAIYWLSGKEDKRILFDVSDGALTVSDTGPGVDPDDVENLFELFFSRRVRGRGVGLYLCRQTLAAGGHRIEYVTDPAKKKLPGANFAITLRNGFDA